MPLRRTFGAPSRESWGVIFRYFSVSASVYLYIMGAMYVMVDFFGFQKVPSYVIVYLVAYIMEYLSTLILVFKKGHSWAKLLKFIMHTAAFLAIGTFVFQFILTTGINYLIATIATAVVLLPFRFLSNKYLVYK